MRLVAEHTRNQLSFRRTFDLKFLVGFLLDYPEEHRGNMVGLAEKAIRWHLDQAQAEADRVAAQLGGQRETAKPPIALPNDPRIMLLSTVDDIVAEGRAMGNCVSSYAGSAVRGECYLLHAAKDGEDATIEVTWRGEVSQAVRPRNRLNDTARWGRRVLSRWGKTFPKDFVLPELPSGPSQKPNYWNFAFFLFSEVRRSPISRRSQVPPAHTLASSVSSAIHRRLLGSTLLGSTADNKRKEEPPTEKRGE